jgi:hypothetical protein
VNDHVDAPVMPEPFADALTEAVYVVDVLSAAEGVNVARRRGRVVARRARDSGAALGRERHGDDPAVTALDSTTLTGDPTGTLVEPPNGDWPLMVSGVVSTDE